MLKINKTELKIISDNDYHFFIEKRMRGGNSYIAKRYSKGNKQCIKCYDADKPSKCITYLDTNNLYGWAMSQYLSYN